jgi:hypothetical protein
MSTTNDNDNESNDPNNNNAKKEQDNCSIEKYNDQMNIYMSTFSDNYIMFEVCKCCGYSAFIPCYKNGTLHDLYNAVCYYFGSNIVPDLYVYNQKIDARKKLPNDETITIKEYMSILPYFFKAVYPLPAKVVIKLYVNETACGCQIAKTPMPIPMPIP